MSISLNQTRPERRFSIDNSKVRYDFSLHRTPDNDLYRISTNVSVAVRGNTELGTRLLGVPQGQSSTWQQVRELDKIILLPTKITGFPVERSTVGDFNTMNNLFNFISECRRGLIFDAIGDRLVVKVSGC